MFNCIHKSDINIWSKDQTHNFRGETRLVRPLCDQNSFMYFSSVALALHYCFILCYVKFFSDSVIFCGESTEAYYYVEILVYSGNASGLFEMDINVNSGQLKFAKFKKFDHSRGGLFFAAFFNCFFRFKPPDISYRNRGYIK